MPFLLSIIDVCSDIAPTPELDKFQQRTISEENGGYKCSTECQSVVLKQQDMPTRKKPERQRMFLPLIPDSDLYHFVQHPPKMNIYSPVSPLSIFPFRQHELCSPMSTSPMSPSSIPSPCSDVSMEYNSLSNRLTPDICTDALCRKTDIDLKILPVQLFYNIMNLRERAHFLYMYEILLDQSRKFPNN